MLGKPGTLQFRSGFKLRVLRPIDLLVAAEAILFDCYKIAQSPPPRSVIDVGGALGEFGLFIAHRFPSAKVTIFEPNPESFAVLRENAALNGLKNVDLEWACVGPDIRYDFPAHHSVRNSVIAADSRYTQVPGTRLADFIHDEVDILKVDTEGFEIPVLKTAGNKLAQIRTILLEYHESIVPGQRRVLEQILVDNRFVVTSEADPFDEHLGLMFAVRSEED